MTFSYVLTDKWSSLHIEYEIFLVLFLDIYAVANDGELNISRGGSPAHGT